jgi:isoquinoline 1-oxidoreductase beta subunit
MKTQILSRRGFLITSAAAGGGLALGLAFPGGSKALAQNVARVAATQSSGNEVGAWVVIRPNDEVVIRIARSEMGQGTLTGLAQLVVEELECDWNKVTWEYPTPGENHRRKRVWGDMSTGGSRGIRTSQEYVRKAGATAREMLIAAAAEAWKVPASECVAEKSVITHAPTGRKTTFGKVAAAAAQQTPPKEIKLKDPKTWKIAGQPLPRLDTFEKLNGRQLYSIDVKLPGMLNAAIKDAPVYGTKVKSFDDSAASALPGFRRAMIVDETAVAVVAETWWQAKTALDAIKIVYEDTPNANVQQADIVERLRDGLTSKDNVFPGNVAGDALKAIEGAAKKVEAIYFSPFVAHATMEPMNATARYTVDLCEVWTSTQNGEAAHAAASAASGLPLDKCEVYKYLLGGGFGRRGRVDYVRQAVLIARQMPGVPIKLIWSREEDQAQDTYRPIGMTKVVGALDEKGDLVGMHMRIAAQSVAAFLFPSRLQNGMDAGVFSGLNAKGLEGQFGYDVPNLYIEHAMRNSHVPVGFWRGVNANQNAFWTECFIDECAKAAGADPLEFRRKHLAKSPKHLAVLNAAATKADYGAPLPEGVFRGIAQFMSYGTYTAAVAEVSVSDSGRLKVHRLVIATDPGHVVNPDQVIAQIEGAAAYGLGAMLYQEMTIKNGAVTQLNFDTHDSMRIDEMPKIEAVLVPSGGFWGGVGEPTIAVCMPAVLNAIYAATGTMQRAMPLKNVKLRQA